MENFVADGKIYIKVSFKENIDYESRELKTLNQYLIEANNYTAEKGTFAGAAGYFVETMQARKSVVLWFKPNSKDRGDKKAFYETSSDALGDALKDLRNLGFSAGVVDLEKLIDAL
jgi:hypothetical protein